MMEQNDIEETLHTLSQHTGLSVAKLKALYSRGIKECLDQGYEGLPYVYGMARVQRFVMAHKTGNYRLTPDQDFAPRSIENSDPISYEITADSVNGWSLIYDVMSADGNKVSQQFPYNNIEQTIYDTDTHELCVLGSDDGVQWIYTLNLSTGESILTINEE